MLFADILVFVILALLGLEACRSLLRRFVPGVKVGHLDIAYITFVVIGAVLYFPKATSDEALRESLSTTKRQLKQTETELRTAEKKVSDINQALDKTRQELATETSEREKAAEELIKAQQDLAKAQSEVAKVNQRESLRRWAMLLPTGDEAHDVMARERSSGGKRSKDFSKVFQPTKGGGSAFGGARCDNKEYIEDIRGLMNQYEKSPYPRVALAYCLKRLGDERWKKEAAQAKVDLEFYMSIEPHVIAIESMYGGLMQHILEDKVKLEDTGFFVLGEENVYRPKNMPP